MKTIDENEIIKKVEEFLKLENFKYKKEMVEEKIKELCLAKLCLILGLRWGYNYTSSFFNCFASVSAEAVCQVLEIPLTIAEERIRFVRYNNINFIDKSVQFLKTEIVTEAFLNMFRLIDENKNIILKVV